MSNNYSQWSWMLHDLTPAEVAGFTRLLAELGVCEDVEGEDVEGEDDLQLTGVRFELDPHALTLWVYSEEAGDVGATAEAIKAVLAAAKSDRIAQGTWAATCSKMRVDEFAGGGVVITKDEIVWFNPTQQMSDWVEAKARGLEHLTTAGST